MSLEINFIGRQTTKWLMESLLIIIPKTNVSSIFEDQPHCQRLSNIRYVCCPYLIRAVYFQPPEQIWIDIMLGVRFTCFRLRVYCFKTHKSHKTLNYLDKNWSGMFCSGVEKDQGKNCSWIFYRPHDINLMRFVSKFVFDHFLSFQVRRCILLIEDREQLFHSAGQRHAWSGETVSSWASFFSPTF